MHRTIRRAAWCLSSAAAAAALLPSAAGALRFTPQPFVRTGAGPDSVVVADFNGDGVLDLANANMGYYSTVSVLIGVAGGGYARKVDYAIGAPMTAWAVEIEVADVDGDGADDLVVADSSTAGRVVVLPGTGSGTFLAAVGFATGTTPRALEVLDLNGDGALDVVTADGTTRAGTVSVLLGNGAGSFSAPTTTSAGTTYSEELDSGDFNGDGALDVAVTSGSTRAISLLLGDGAGGFTSTVSVPAGIAVDGVVAADFDNDGALDLAGWFNHGDTVTTMLGDGAGGFAAPVAFPSWPYLRPQHLVAADFDGDGIVDLANSGGSHLLWLGVGDGTFVVHAGLGFTGSNVSSLAVADFNGDGRPDLVGSDYPNNVLYVTLNT